MIKPIKPSWRDQLRTKHSITSLIDWANTMTTLSGIELTQRLLVPIAPNTLRLALLEEAHASRSFAKFARSWLVRLLHEKADSSSFSTLFDPDKTVAAAQIWKKVEAHRAANPQWLPVTADDPVLVELFAPFDLHRSARVAKIAAAFAKIDGLECLALGDLLAQVGSKLPVGFTYLASMRWLDTEVRSGGFEQLFSNGGDKAIAGAIEGFELAGSPAAQIVRESQNTLGVGRTRAELDTAYATVKPSMFDLAAKLLEARPDLFDSPFTELRHADGRVWRVRVIGARLDLEIVIGGDDVVARNRTFDSAASADAEARRLIDEQEREGFARLN